MFSRGMILNSIAIIVGLCRYTKLKIIAPNIKFSLVTLSAFIALLISSVLAVNYIRTHKYADKKTPATISKIESTKQYTLNLIADRWVGIDGVMAVVSYPDKGWPLWKRAWQETNTKSGTSLYDKEIANDSVYNYADLNKHHFISLPGIIAFFYYPGSLWFLFLAMMITGILSIFAEHQIKKYSRGNIIYTSLIAMVIATRLSHFGYAPKQTYLLLATIILNTAIIYAIDVFLRTRKH
jgi:hypothetical protein